MASPMCERGTVTIPAGSSFNGHRLRTEISLEYLDWRGANAGIYMQRPGDKNAVNCGPNLELDEPQRAINKAASTVLDGLAARYHHLLRVTELPPADRKELAGLQTLFNN